jgi:hypothetical protein
MRPRCILIEGPSDSTHLIQYLLAPDTRPPVAILAFYPPTEDAPPISALWPFSSYSPEWVALTVGAEVGAELRFIDAPAGLALTRRAEMRAQQPKEGESRPETPPEQPLPQLLTDLAKRFGYDTYAEFWESRFEMMPGEDMDAAMLEFGQLVREQPSPDRDWTAYNDQREAWMRAQVHQALDDGFDPDEMMIVCGAAHAPVLDVTRQSSEMLSADLEHVAALSEENMQAARLTLIPYSFLRLSEQVGYGAGNHAPAYYQMIWDKGLDFEAATQEYLIRIAHAMQEAGFVVSTADTIEANRLARGLAGLRDKPMPGYFELREAAEACYGRGQVKANAFLVPITVGDAVGSISQQVERTTIQEEFYTTITAMGLPLSDSVTHHTLHLTEKQDVDASIFLHRLNAIGVPYGHLRSAQPGRGSAPPPIGSLLRRIQRNKETKRESADLLGQLREHWTLQWSPATDISLIEKSILGNTLEDLCRRFFRERLDEARNVKQASEVLLKIVLAGLASLYDDALSVCERISAHDTDIEGQARAAQKLQLLLAYGSTRALDQAPIAPLLTKVFTRASFLLPDAAAVSNDAAPAVLDSIKVLYEVAQRSDEADEDILIERLQRTLDDDETHPSVRGLCVALLFIGGRLSEQEMLRWLNYHLTSKVSPVGGAQFLEGFLALNRAVILRNPTVVTWLNTFVERLSFDTFVETLPVMRRAFSVLSRSELEYLASALLGVLGVEAEQAITIGKALSEDELIALNEEINKQLGRKRDDE